MSTRSKRRKTKRGATRWRAPQAREAIARWRASGLSATAFCKKEGVSVQRLYWWQKRLGVDGSEQSNVPPAPEAFVPAAIMGASPAVSVSIAGGAVVLEAESGEGLPSAAWVISVAKALRRRA